jgi:hypothetical protein
MATDLTGPSAFDDRSSYLHRQTIGALGAALPFLVWLIAGLRPADFSVGRWRLHDSISAYYHTSGVVAFVGVLSALSVRLLTYQGFGNGHGTQDRFTARLAGICAALVAFFPTAVKDGPRWLKPWVSNTHYVAATVLFGCFMFISLFLFTKSGTPHPTRRKQRRNAVYRVCGIAIGTCLAWIAGLKLFRRGEVSIFWPEALALWFFAFSWLTKGRADHTLVRLLEYTRHPRRVVREVRKNLQKLKGTEAVAPTAGR